MQKEFTAAPDQGLNVRVQPIEPASRIVSQWIGTIAFLNVRAAILLGGIVGLSGLGGCAAPLKPAAFATTTPAFDPVTFWSRPTASWGVVENRDGQPTAIITTSTEATPEGAGRLHMIQHVVTHGKDSVRDWHIRRLGNRQFEATANDLVGTARGAASGRTLHWTWILASKPGNGLFNVKMDQWMYLADDGTLMIRTIVTKLGIRLAEISEQFVRRPAQ
jgi:hypothetical protein